MHTMLLTVRPPLHYTLKSPYRRFLLALSGTCVILKEMRGRLVMVSGRPGWSLALKWRVAPWKRVKRRRKKEGREGEEEEREDVIMSQGSERGKQTIMPRVSF